MAAQFVFMNAAPPRAETIYNDEYVDPFSWNDDRFGKEFRMTKEEVNDLAEMLYDDMKSCGSRGCDLTVHQKILISLKTLGSGSFQNTSKDFISISQPTVSRVLDSFLSAIVKRVHQFIYMPRNSEELDKVKQDIYKIARFPGVAGLIDCSQIPIIAPSRDVEYMFVNRKKFHSINTQAICDADAIYMDIVAKWPGSHHDSFILNTSAISDRFAEGEFGDKSWLIGDSGYGLKSWLMTPINKPRPTDAEKEFNKSLTKTRCVVERSFGILKSRWRILDHTGGAMCYKPEKVCRIILACCILHNICRRNGTPLYGDDGTETDFDSASDDLTSDETTPSGEQQRARLVQMFANA